jgi:hypothetical protein
LFFGKLGFQNAKKKEKGACREALEEPGVIRENLTKRHNAINQEGIGLPGW